MVPLNQKDSKKPKKSKAKKEKTVIGSIVASPAPGAHMMSYAGHWSPNAAQSILKPNQAATNFSQVQSFYSVVNQTLAYQAVLNMENQVMFESKAPPADPKIVQIIKSSKTQKQKVAKRHKLISTSAHGTARIPAQNLFEES